MKATRLESPDARTTTLLIAKMDCPTEEGLIRGKLRGMPGIRGMQFNLVQRKLTLLHDAQALPGALAALKSLGLEVQSESSGAETVAQGADPTSVPRWPLLALAGLAAVASEIVEWTSGELNWIVIALALVAISTGGFTTYKKGWIALRNRNLNMNALMSIAVTGAMLIGHWPESAMVMFLFALAEVIEAKSLDRARNAIRGLMDLAPQDATVRQDDGSWQSVPAGNVVIGSMVRLRPGERIALDGQVSAGRSTVNQAPITGESLPVEKAQGDLVFAGTINESGSFEYRVTAVADQSTLARIIHAVEAAQSARAPRSASSISSRASIPLPSSRWPSPWPWYPHSFGGCLGLRRPTVLSSCSSLLVPARWSFRRP